MKHHMAISLHYLNREIARAEQNDLQQEYLTDSDNKPISNTDALAVIQEYRDKGYDVFPPCEHIDAHGHCLGHDN